MKHAHAVFLCLSTTLVTFPIVRCRPENPVSVMMLDFPERLTTEISYDVKKNENENSQEENSNTAFPPEGAGIFRDPVEVLGPKFPPSVTIYLCEVQLHEHADEISDIKFTGKGNKTCADVCNQYHANIKFDGPVDIVLVQSYCDYAGMSDFEGDNFDLSTTCTCMFKVGCYKRTKVVMYIFEANCKGYLKVSLAGIQKKTCIS